MRIGLPLLLCASCRGWHDPLPFDECQPYPLACDGCTFDDEIALAPDDILRLWGCEDPAFGPLLAARRRSVDAPADDTHFYEQGSGLRVAAVREHDEVVGVCGRELEQEWWGEILDCVDGCELDPSRPEADPELPACEE